MTGSDTNLDLVTGALSYSGAHIAERLLQRGREVRTLTFHPDRRHPLHERVQAHPYRFDDPIALARSLEGVTTLYNTYWVRFDHHAATFAGAIANSRALFHAARRAGVTRIVHLSIANPSVDSPLPYYRGKAQVEHALAEVGVRFSIVRPSQRRCPSRSSCTRSGVPRGAAPRSCTSHRSPWQPQPLARPAAQRCRAHCG
jgi:uncharacterized protein YbjT (DUF2867 family)